MSIEFNVIIVKADEAKAGEIAAGFSRVLGLDEAMAAPILKSAPIILLAKATKAEVKALTPRLAELSRLGVEFRVTARPLGKIPKVNWPIRPQFAVGSPSGGGATFSWDHSAFVCPGCGETYVFKRVGKLPLGEPAAAPAELPIGPVMSGGPVHSGSFGGRGDAPAPSSFELPSAPPPPPSAKAPASRTEPILSEGLDLGPPPARKSAPSRAPEPPPEPESELELLSEEMSPPPQPEAPTPPAPPKAAAKKVPVTPPPPASASDPGEITSIDEPLEALDEGMSGMEVESLDEVRPLGEPVAAKPAAGKPAPAKGDTKARARMQAMEETDTHQPVFDEALLARPSEEKTEAHLEPADPGGGDGEFYNVFLQKIAAPDRKEKAAQMIAEIKGIPLAEAKELTGRLVIPLLKDVSKIEAERVLEQFKKIKVMGRMTRKK